MFWILVVVSLSVFVYWKYTKALTYWKKRGVPQARLTKLLINSWRILSRSISFIDLMVEDYEAFKDKRFSGSYQFVKPTLTIRSPDLIKQITVKDFDHFADHQHFVSEQADPLWAKNLVSLKGEKWREMRATLSPSFTSSKMRSMFVLISECSERLVEHFAAEGKNTIELEMKDTFTRYANDVIATSAFGISCDSLAEKNNEFYLMGKEATNFTGFWQTIKFIIMTLSPNLCKILGIKMFKKKIGDFFKTLVKETIRIREKEGIVRPDMIHLLMEARKGRLNYEEQNEKESETGFATVEESQVGKSGVIRKSEITDIDITAQVFIFFFAGFDTVSTAMSFMAYELAVHPEVQQKLYQEIDDVLSNSNGKCTYEAILKMKYLDMVVSETLRKWPPAIASDRECVKSYTIQPENKNEVPVEIEKGVVIVIPQFAIHRDEKYYPEPARFDPERFSDENKKNIDPYAYMPFGLGPRNCIGSRFALLETKALFVNLLFKFEIVVTKKTPIPLTLTKGAFTLVPENGIWLGLKLRNK